MKKERPYDRFQDAIKCVVRNLGGSRQVLLAAGYIPSEWKGLKKGFWLTPYNPNIMWRTKDAIIDHFSRFRWEDRAESAWEANCPKHPNVKYKFDREGMPLDENGNRINE